MTERLTFTFRKTGVVRPLRAGANVVQPFRAAESGAGLKACTTPERWDTAFAGLMLFTALLFFRPQDHLAFLKPLHLAELAAVIGLIAMVFSRLGRGLMFTRVTPELVGVVALGLLILALAPFSIWMGGAIGTFTNVYVKVILIFVLMVNTLTTRRRIEQFTWLIVIATGYIAFRAVFDYARGINLIENGRVQGAVGGMFKNPNDLALNMVAVVPLGMIFALRSWSLMARLLAAGCTMLMVGAVIATHSRSGTVGLAAMMLLFGAYMLRRRPGLVFAGALLFVFALPFAPESYWNRVASITDASQDDTGSREARRVLLRESWAAFLANPITGVGAGQFKNYAPDQREEAWRETHNVVLQVAAELGVGGLLVFGFLVARSALATRQVRTLLKRAPVTADERAAFEAHAVAMAAALAGWFVCALFASVAYTWTFYYLLALATAPRELLIDRLPAARRSRASLRVAPAAHEVGT